MDEVKFNPSYLRDLAEYLEQWEKHNPRPETTLTQFPHMPDKVQHGNDDYRITAEPGGSQSLEIRLEDCNTGDSVSVVLTIGQLQRLADSLSMLYGKMSYYHLWKSEPNGRAYHAWKTMRGQAISEFRADWKESQS